MSSPVASPAATFTITPKPVTSTNTPAQPAQQSSLSLKPQVLSTGTSTQTTAQQQPIQFTSASTPLSFAPLPATTAAPATFSLQPKPMTFTISPQQQQQQQQQPVSAAAPLSFQPVALSSQQQQQSAATPTRMAMPSSAGVAPASPATHVGSASPHDVPLPSVDAVPPCPVVASLPCVDDEKALDQTGEWSFFVELMQDVFNDRAKMVGDIVKSIGSNDHVQLQKDAHAIKGVALNLHLPALSDPAKKLEMMAKQLQMTPQAQDYLDARHVMLRQLNLEYDRLHAVLPEYQARAEAEAEGMEEEMGE